MLSNIQNIITDTDRYRAVAKYGTDVQSTITESYVCTYTVRNYILARTDLIMLK